MIKSIMIRKINITINNDQNNEYYVLNLAYTSIFKFEHETKDFYTIVEIIL